MYVWLFVYFHVLIFFFYLKFLKWWIFFYLGNIFGLQTVILQVLTNFDDSFISSGFKKKIFYIQYDRYILTNVGAETIYNSASWTVKKKPYKDNIGFIIYKWWKLHLKTFAM